MDFKTAITLKAEVLVSSVKIECNWHCPAQINLMLTSPKDAWAVLNERESL